MATAFVTGVTGFIGSHVALCLLAKGWRVRALRRSTVLAPDMGKLEIEWCSGDIRNFDQIHSVMAGCEAVFHVAADYRLWARNPEEIYEMIKKVTIQEIQDAAIMLASFEAV